MENKIYAGIIKHKRNVFGMDVDEIIVSDAAVQSILQLQTSQLTKTEQSEAVARLVARTPDYEQLDAEVAGHKIIVALTQETVVKYLAETGEIDGTKEDVSYECGIDEEGSIHVTVMYPNTPREVRRAIKKQLGAKEMARQEQVMEEVMNQSHLLEEAKKKLAMKLKSTERKTKSDFLKRIK